MRLRLGTRGSALAVAQSESVAQLLRSRGHDVELVRIKTRGDMERGSLTRLGTLGVFAAELRTAILDGRCDFAVHSLKDLPTAPVPGLTIAAIPGREDPRDALVAGGQRLAELPAGAAVGTGSPRRVAQLRALRPDLRFVDVRGNIGTRLARVADDDLAAVVLAAAGLRRLGFDHLIDELLPIIGAPGQGALALECRADADDVLAQLRPLDDARARLAVEEERAVLALLGGGCAAPIAATAVDGVLSAAVSSLDGAASARAVVPLRVGAGREAVQQLRAAGAELVADLRATRPSRLAELHDDESLWLGDGSLAGMQVLLPREEGALADGLRAAGAEVTCCPVLETVVLATPEVLAADWVVFTSPRGVALLDRGPTRVAGRIAAVGGATARALTSRGYAVDLCPEGASSAAALLTLWPAGSGRVLLPGSARSGPELAEGLSRRGYTVERLATYDVHAAATVPEPVVAAWRRGDFDAVVITSGSVGEAFSELFGWHDTPVVAFGPPSAEALRAAGVPVAGTAPTQDPQGVAAALARLPG